MAPNYIAVSPAVYREIKQWADYHQTWMVDLFSPRGLGLLFRLK